jgi:hypothetical protein
MHPAEKCMSILRFRWPSINRFWPGAGIVIGSICVVIFVLNQAFCIPVMQAATAVGSVSTAVGVLLALLTLRHTHEWNRRHYTVEFLDDWNENARSHLTVLEKQFPEFFAVPDFIKNPDLMNSWRLSEERAKQLVAVKSESEGLDSDELDIRGHLLELLNYFEGIATCL